MLGLQKERYTVLISYKYSFIGMTARQSGIRKCKTDNVVESEPEDRRETETEILRQQQQQLRRIYKLNWNMFGQK